MSAPRGTFPPYAFQRAPRRPYALCGRFVEMIGTLQLGESIKVESTYPASLYEAAKLRGFRVSLRKLDGYANVRALYRVERVA